MWRPTIRSDCCTDRSPTCDDFKCFQDDIHAELKRLYCRHKANSTKSARLQNLAVQKLRLQSPIYEPQCPCPFAKPARLVPVEEFAHTRTVQLAYPIARKMFLFKQANRKLMPERMGIIMRTLRSSMFSLYSRLANFVPPPPKYAIQKWDKSEWKRHTRYCKRLAKPKLRPEMKGPPNPQMPLNTMKRFKKLARPKRRIELEKEEWVFTKNMLNFKPSQRLVVISQPRSPVKKWEPTDEVKVEIKPEALKYKPTRRIQELSKPLEKRSAASDLKDDPFTISPNALKYKASKRIKEIAEPKEFENAHIRENPFAISPQALKAKASPRILELAQPKNPKEKFKSPN